MRKKTTINKSNFTRVLLSETSPLDVPVIFTNTYFYQNKNEKKDITKQKLMDFLFEEDNVNRKKPIKYKILKDNSGGIRSLSLLHPSSQSHIEELYRKYADRILYHCNMSPCSLRYPAKVSGMYIEKSFHTDSSKYKGSNPSTTEEEDKLEYITSYFSYQSTSALHNFFESKDYLALEAKFIKLYLLDISSCFDNIYTHSIAWAVKGKSLSQNSTGTLDFANAMDRVVQLSNNTETNGIPVGNEFSRIFSEIILQSADRNLLTSLERKNIQHNIDFSVRRYVDDYFLFVNSDDVANKVIHELERSLRFYKLSLNANKASKIERPLITDITKARVDVNNHLNQIFDLLFNINNDGTISFKRIYKPDKLTRKFIDLIMKASRDSPNAYKTMASYCIGALRHRVDLLQINTSSDGDSQNEDIILQNGLAIILDVSFHLFCVNPTTRNSLKLSQICYFIINKISHSNNSEHHIFETRLLMSNKIKLLFDSGHFKIATKDKSFLPLEFSNLLCVSRNLCPDHLLSADYIEELFEIKSLEGEVVDYIELEESNEYFQLMAALYYCSNDTKYKNVVIKISNIIDSRLKNVMNLIRTDARILYLFLDSMSCPFIPTKHKEKWFSQFINNSGIKSHVEETDHQYLFDLLITNSWFICWNKLDLWNIMARKELLPGY